MNPWDNDPELTAAMEALRVATAAYEVARNAAADALEARHLAAMAMDDSRRAAATAERAASIRWVESLPEVKVSYLLPRCKIPRETLAHLAPDGWLWVVATWTGRGYSVRDARGIGRSEWTISVGLDHDCRVVSVVEARP